MRSSLLTASLLALGAVLPLVAAAPVVFDSFSYTGRDTVFESPLPSGSFRNPILSGFYPDPSICQVGEDYYLINSTFAYFPGIPIFHSRDLINWTQLGHVIDRPSQLPYAGLGVTRGIFAPAISHHNGVFYVVCTHVDGGGNFLMTATNPAGPWSDPIYLKFDGIDPSLFFDDDGRAWMVNNGNPPDNQPLYQGHRAIWIQEFDIAKQQMTGPRSIIVNGGADLTQKPVWIEGPHLYKRDGWYYLCCAEGGTSDQHSQVILRGKSPTGPFVPWEKNPILTQRDLDGTAPHAITCTGHADLVVGPDGQWWSVFLACRPYDQRFFTTGRETFLLPVEWTADGWPVILPPGQRVPTTVKAPVLSTTNAAPRVANSELALSGNFTWRDDFSAAQLSPLWIMLRTPSETWWKLDATAGTLALTPRAEPLGGKGNPSFLARRLQHAKFNATTTLTAPTEAGVSAGLVAFQSETHYYYLGVRRTATGLTAFVEVADGQAPASLATAALPADTTRLELRITGDESKITFATSTQTGMWQSVLANAPTHPITVQAAGGGLHFTGAVLGLHARTE